MGNCCGSRRRTGTGESQRLITCNKCQLPCGHVEGQFYIKCLQCGDNLNFCKSCYLEGFHHKSHVNALVDNDCRHQFIEEIAERTKGWPILGPLPLIDRNPMFPLKCMNLTSGDNNLHSKKRCGRHVSWICLQCPTNFSLCQSCMRLPFQHSHHIFVMAPTYDLQRYIIGQENYGILPLP